MMRFLAMGGYAAFVWPAYAVTFASLGAALLVTLRSYARAKAAFDKVAGDQAP